MKDKVQKVIEYAESLGLSVVMNEYDDMFIIDVLKSEEDGED